MRISRMVNLANLVNLAKMEDFTLPHKGTASSPDFRIPHSRCLRPSSSPSYTLPLKLGI